MRFIGDLQAHLIQPEGFGGHVRLHTFLTKDKGGGLVLGFGKVFHVWLDLRVIELLHHRRPLFGDCKQGFPAFICCRR